MTRTPADPATRPGGLWVVVERPTRINVATRRTGASLAEQPWQKSDVTVLRGFSSEEAPVNAIIYLVGLVVIVMAILSFIGLR